MRTNLTKKDLVNSIYMQVGFSKQISEHLIDEFFSLITLNLKKEKKLYPLVFLKIGSQIIFLMPKTTKLNLYFLGALGLTVILNLLKK